MGEEIAPKCEKCNKRLWNHTSSPDREVCMCIEVKRKTFQERLQEKALERGSRLYTEAELKKFFKEYWTGIDINSKKPIIITPKQLLSLMNAFGKYLM